MAGAPLQYRRAGETGRANGEVELRRQQQGDLAGDCATRLSAGHGGAQRADLRVAVDGASIRQDDQGRSGRPGLCAGRDRRSEGHRGTRQSVGRCEEAGDRHRRLGPHGEIGALPGRDRRASGLRRLRNAEHRRAQFSPHPSAAQRLRPAQGLGGGGRDSFARGDRAVASGFGHALTGGDGGDSR